MDYEEFGLPGEEPEEPEKPTEHEEIEDWCIADVHYRATKSQSNEISVRAYATEEWLEYATADDLMRHTPNLPSLSLDDWRGIVRARALAWRKYVQACARVVAEVLR